MATSGSFSTNAYSGVSSGYPRYGTFSWARTNYSIDGNYSDISWSFVADGGNDQYKWTGMKEKYVTVDGETWSNSTLVNATNGTTLLSGTKRIYHDPDGTKSFSVSAGIAVFNYGSYNSTGSSSFNLDTIPRASGVSCSSPYIGDSAVITIDKKSSSFTNTVTYSIGEITGTIATKTTETVLQLATSSLKSQIYALIPNGRSVTGTIYCTTYNGDTQIGDTQSATFNLYAKEEDCKPTVSGVVIDTNADTIALTGDNLFIVKNASKPKVTITATSNYSSTISSYNINLNDGQTSNQQEHTFDTINSNLITVSATDSREYSNSYPIDLTNRVIDYVKLHFNTVDLQRPEGTSNEVILNANGVWFNGDFSQNNSNALTCSFQYKKSTDNSWTNGGSITPTISNNTFSFTDVSLGNIYDYNYEYQFKIIVSDLLITVGDNNADVQVVPKGVAVVEIGDEFVNINGSLTKNNAEVPIAKNTKSNSQEDTYSCYFLLDYCHPIGEVFMTTDSSFNPNTSWGGTWEQLSADAYLKIVTSDGGNLGGTSSQHKIPISSMPSHAHVECARTGDGNWNPIQLSQSGGDSGGALPSAAGWTNYGTGYGSTYSTGGSQAYYPYYYGVYAWHRTA